MVTRPRRSRVLLTALGISGAVIFAGIALSGFDAGPEAQRLKGDADRDTFESHAAGITNDDDVDAYVRPATIWPVTNYWGAADGQYGTVVVAGRDPDDRSLGLFAIHHTTFAMREPATDLSLVEVPGAGTLRITDAPTGRGPVQTRAQLQGRLRFDSAKGVSGVLDLSDQTVRVAD